MIYLIATIAIVYFSIFIWFLLEWKKESNMINEE